VRYFFAPQVERIAIRRIISVSVVEALLMSTTLSRANRFFMDAMSPAFREDPYPFYDRYRSEGLLQVADTIWFALAHDDVSALLRQPKLSSHESRLSQDPAGHARLRGLVAGAFTPRRIETLRTTAQAIASELIDGLLARSDSGPVDLIEAFAHPFPMRVICSLLGVTEADRPTFTAWSASVARVVEPSILRSPEVEAEIERDERALAAYFGDLIERRRCDPGDDLLSAVVAAESAGDRIKPREVVDIAMLLLVAGHETTMNLIGNGMLALLSAPDQLARLRRSPELVPAAVDELLRYDSPLQATRRVATENLELCGRPVNAGSELMLILGAANRDPAVFAEPHRLDVTRDARRHVAFGGGVHHCLGIALARLEGVIAFNALLQRCPEMRLADEPERRQTYTLRGLQTLPVSISARQ
jgi:cytochrome P450